MKSLKKSTRGLIWGFCVRKFDKVFKMTGFWHFNNQHGHYEKNTPNINLDL
jgi:hypothetical protein